MGLAATTLTLDILTPGEAVAFRDVLFVNLPAENGRLTVLPNHQPLVALLTRGSVVIRRVTPADEPSPGSGAAATQQEVWTIGPGSLRVADNHVTLLVREAAPAQRASPS